MNAEGDITRGVDIGLQANTKIDGGTLSAALDGTYIDSFRSRLYATDAYTELVGQWGVQDLFVRWKHALRFTYTKNDWSTTLFQYYTSGYKDEVPAGVANAPDYNPDVDSYTIYNLSTTYSGLKNWTFTGSVKHLLNTDPPFTAHNVDFAAGTAWDPRVANPRGRAYMFRLTYKF